MEDLARNIHFSDRTEHAAEDAAELEAFGPFSVDDLQGRSSTTRRNTGLVNTFHVAVTDARPVLTDEPNILGSKLDRGAGKHYVT